MRLLRAFAVGLMLALALNDASAAWAQTKSAAAIDYKAWDATASRAESVLATGRASSASLQVLRQQIVDYRAKLQAAQAANSDRIKTLTAQIAGLGPPPKAGTTEPAEIAKRRAELAAELKTAKAPALTAEEAYRRADGLARQIDKTVRERQANALVELGPSPVNPANWPAVLADLTTWARGLRIETQSAWGRPTTRAQFRARVPLMLFYLALALALLVESHVWVRRAVDRVYAGGLSRPAARVLAFVVSLAEPALLMIGVLALARAFFATGVVGLRGDVILAVLPQIGLAIIAARWLAGVYFDSRAAVVPQLSLSAERRAHARWHAAALGGALGAQMLLLKVAPAQNFSAAGRAVLGFVLIAIGAWLLYRVGRSMASQAASGTSESAERSYRAQIMRVIGRGVMTVALAGPALAAFGYLNAGATLVFPSILSLALLALVAILKRLVSDLYALATGADEAAHDSLIPVLIGLVLTLLAVPVLALIWGAKVSDLTEIWARFGAGFQLGSARISPTDFVIFAVVFVVGYTLTRALQGTLRTTVLPRTKVDIGARMAIISGAGYVGIMLSALVAISAAGIDLTSLAIVAGALSVGIGFGLQNIVSNFVSGIILLIERPIKPGDWIKVGAAEGYVRAISVRSTRIQTFDRSDVIVPNADLIAGAVTNYTLDDHVGRVIIKVGVAYGTDTRKVAKILEEIAAAHPMTVSNPPPGVAFVAFGADSLDFEVRAILRDVNYILSVKSDINHEIAHRFAAEGIEIPFAQRDVWFRNPEALAAAGNEEKKT